MKSFAIISGCLIFAFPFAIAARQANPPAQPVQQAAPSRQASPPKREQLPQEPNQNAQETSQERQQPSSATAPGDEEHGPPKELHFDMTEVPPAVTHHEIHVNGKLLRYIATAGRLPIKDATGKTEALMFYAAYTLDDVDSSQRPLTFPLTEVPARLPFGSIWERSGRAK